MTSIDLLALFKEELEAAVDGLGEEVKQLAIDTAKDYAELRAKKLLGDDSVDHELQIVESTLKDLSVAGAITAANVMNSAIEKGIAWATKFLVTVAV